MKRLHFVFLAICVTFPLLGQGNGVIDCPCTEPSGFDPKAFWSDARTESAKALELPSLTSTQVKQLMLRTTSVRDDEQDFEISASALLAPGVAPGQSEPADLTVLPHSLVGKLFFMKNGQASYCTAQLVGNNSIILTAAHCVRDEHTGKFHEKFSFIPGYKDGTKRFAYVRCVATWSTFPHTILPNHAVDYAFGRLENPLNGHLGLKARLPVDQWVSVGYPQVPDHEQQRVVRGGKRDISNGIVEMTENQMQEGASGGAFIADLPKGPTAISVNSFTSAGLMYGPFFDGSLGQLYSHVLDGCPKP